MNALFLTIALFGFSAVNAIHLSVKNGSTPDAKYCIVLDSNMSGQIHYYDNVKNETVPYNFVVNTTSDVTGQCHGVAANLSTETLRVFFLPDDITPNPPPQQLWSIELIFGAPHNTLNSFKIVNYTLKTRFYPDYFNTSLPYNETAVYTMKPNTELEWAAIDSHGFSCSSSDLPLTNSSSITFSSLKVLAFAILDDDQFPQEQLFEQCKLDVRTSDLVPIIVGVCLAGLVIVVLIAYIIGRARAKRQGYASV